MITTQFFNGSMSSDEMQSTYRKLAKIWHPDLNKDKDTTATMQAINAEYGYWYARVATSEVKAVKEKEYGKYPKEYDTPEFLQRLADEINWIYTQNIDRIEGINVTLRGVYIWIDGAIMREMPELRKTLKEDRGFTWNASKASWMFNPTGTKTRFYGKTTMQDIEDRYGAKKLNRETFKKIG